MSVIGFDIGNENCVIATAKAGGIEVLDNEFSSRFTPSYVGFTNKSRCLGTNAKSKLVMNVNNTIFGFKKILGQKFKDMIVQHERAYLPYDIFETATEEVGVKVNYLNEHVSFSVTQIMAMMLTKLKQVSEMKLGKKVKDCVISVPIYYSDSERRAMLNAAEVAGLNPLRLMNEPTAAALTYGFYKQDLTDEPYNVVFVDFGNSALTVSACAFSEQKFRVLGSVWHRNIGGRDFDNILVEYFAEDFKNRYQIDVMTNKKALLSLMMECESLKKQMSASVLELNFCIECLMDDKDVRGKMKRELFEKLSSRLFMTVEETLYKILEETSLEPENIHSVQIVGGSCRIPAVKMLVQKVFRREPSATLNMDEAVARGCALQCALLSPTLRTKNFIIEDIQPYSIKVGWKMYKVLEPVQLFPRFHKAPASKIITFSTNKPFSMQVFYENVFVSPDIAEFLCAKFPPEIQDKDIDIAMKASVNLHGIFEINAADAIFEHEDDNLTLETESSPVENAKESEIKDAETSEEKEVPTKLRQRVTKTTFPLDIFSKFSSVSSIDLKELIASEKVMIQRDMNEKDRADARNALEEYILDMRSKLNYELKEFVTEEEREVLEESFNNAETWLYDDQERKSEECIEKLLAQKCVCDPVLKKFEEWEKKLAITEEFKRKLENAFDAINFICKEMNDVEIKEVEIVRCLWRRTQEYLENCVDTFAKFQKNETCPITAAMVENEMKNFEKQHLIQLQNLKTLLERAKSHEDSGDGKKEEEMNAEISETTSKTEIADMED